MSNSNLLGCKQTSVRGAWMIKSYKKLALFSCRTWWLFFLQIIKYVKFPHSVFIFVLRDFCYKTVLMVMTVSEGSTWYPQLLCSSLKYNWEETLLSVFLLDKLWQLQFRTDESTNTGQKHKSLSTLRLCSLKALVDCNHRIKLNLAHMVRSLFMWFLADCFFYGAVWVKVIQSSTIPSNDFLGYFACCYTSVILSPPLKSRSSVMAKALP